MANPIIEVIRTAPCDAWAYVITQDDSERERIFKIRIVRRSWINESVLLAPKDTSEMGILDTHCTVKSRVPDVVHTIRCSADIKGIDELVAGAARYMDKHWQRYDNDGYTDWMFYPRKKSKDKK